MFTGLIEEIGTVQSLDRSGGKIAIKAAALAKSLKIGDSVAVNGACLTVVKAAADNFTADVMPETFRRTNLGDLKGGSPVNLERAMAAEGRFGGHLVSGHIDGLGKVARIQTEGIAVVITIAAERQLLKEIAGKGSVAVDGVSLTVVEAGAENFSVSIIPHTRAQTTLHAKKIGDKVNIETDLIAKYIARLLEFKERPPQGGITTDLLFKNGFLMA